MYNSRDKAIMLINLSIIPFNSFHNFADYVHKFCLKIMLDRMFMASKAANATSKWFPTFKYAAIVNVSTKEQEIIDCTFNF